MTEAVQIAMIAGFTTAIPAVLTTWLATRLQSRKLDAAKAGLEDKLDQQTVQATVVETKVDEVAHTVNSKADKAAERIEALEGQIVALNAVLLRLATDVKAANGHAGEKPK